MKIGSGVPYTKTIKISKGDNQSTAVHSCAVPPRGKKAHLGALHWVKNQSSKYRHIIYQSTANCMYFQENLTTMTIPQTHRRSPSGQHNLIMTAHPSISYFDDCIFCIAYERKHHHYQNCDTGQVSK